MVVVKAFTYFETNPTATMKGEIRIASDCMSFAGFKSGAGQPEFLFQTRNIIKGTYDATFPQRISC